MDQAPEPAATQRPTVPRPRRVRRSLLWIAAAVLLGIALCEWLQLDSLVAVTAIPPWCWLAACMAIGGLGFSSATRWDRVASGAIAFAFLAFFVEQTWSLGRSARNLLVGGAQDNLQPRLRVVTINCNAGSQSAAREVLRFNPDVVFLQESPNEEAVRDLAETLFGSAASHVWSPDCTVIARGKLEPTNAKARHFVQATLTFIDGQVVEVMYLRLSPPVVRYDLWAPACWSEHAAARRKHCQEAMDIWQALSSVPNERAILIGGDCNAPAGDGALQTWAFRLRDAFGTAGRGWGATVLNGSPVLRFDQLWCSIEIKPRAIWSARTEHSDHRLVVGDFAIPSP
jgi:vancomycin resistance protein VanJ